MYHILVNELIIFIHLVTEIRCNECNESFSTRAIKHLHTCNSILDKQTLAVSGDVRKTKQMTYFEHDDDQIGERFGPAVELRFSKFE